MGSSSSWLSAILGSRRLKTALIAIIAVLTAVDIYATVLVLHQQHVMRDISRYNLTWMSSQAATEVTRLEAVVGAYAIGLPVDRAEVQLRLDIVLNRVQLFQGSEITSLLGSRPDLQRVADQFLASVKAAQPLVDQLPDQYAASQLLTRLMPLNASLARLAAAAHDHSDSLMARDLEKLDELYWIVSGILVLLIIGSFALVCTLIWHNRLLVTAHERVQRSGEALAGAMQEVQARNAVLQERDLALHTQNARFDAALNNMSQALVMVDADQRLIVCNVRYGELFGLDKRALQPGTHVSEVATAIRATSDLDHGLIEAVWEQQQALAVAGESGFFLKEDEQGRALSVWHQPMADGGWVATYEDVTERRSVEAQIEHMAHHDALTGLANRRMFQLRLQESLTQLNRRGDQIAVHCIDLDFFKHVNDTLGHPAGDSLLEEVGRRLRNCVRRPDLVARLGGDEFAVIQMAATEHGAEALANRMVECLSAPYDLGGRKAVIGASVGIALSAGGTHDPEQLFHNADLALYQSKADGRGIFSFFHASMAAEQENRTLIAFDLIAALEREQFQIYYQPILNLEQDTISGYEALLRWEHPDRGMLSPALFIPIAEETGLIVAIGEWALKRACLDAASWRQPLKVAVNLSPVQFRGQELMRAVTSALKVSGLAPDRLELEITESVLLQNNERVLATLHQFRDLGVRTVLDDFGTGYSSLSYLRSFPFDKIKVDKSFVHDMGTRSDCLAIVNSVAGLARALGMTSTAEGVETEEQMEQLRASGFTEIQGYLIGRPAPGGSILALSPDEPRRQVSLLM